MTDRYVPEVIVPIVNLNGSTKTALLDAHLEAIRALQEAQRLVMAAFPHGRDFQTTVPGVYTVAAKQARERIVQLEKILMDFEAITLGISDQN